MNAKKFSEAMSEVNDKYYEDFLKALKLHSSKSDTTLRDIMLERFLAITKK